MAVGGSRRALAMSGVLVLLTSGCAWMQRVSVDSAGGQAAGGSFSASISGDGRYVAFQSDAANLVAGDTNDAGDVFVRENVTGTTSRVSVSSAEDQANDLSYSSAISADGRYVAFFSLASNMVAGDHIPKAAASPCGTIARPPVVRADWTYRHLPNRV